MRIARPGRIRVDAEIFLCARRHIGFEKIGMQFASGFERNDAKPCASQSVD